MGIKKVRVCDSCQRVLNSPRQIWHIYLQSEKYWDVVEASWDSKLLDLCPDCALDIRNSLRRIADRLDLLHEMKQARQYQTLE